MAVARAASAPIPLTERRFDIARMHESTRRALPNLVLAAGVVCIAWSGVLVRWAAVSGIAAGFYRLGIASIVLVPWCAARLRATGAPTVRSVVLGFAAGVLFACDN